MMWMTRIPIPAELQDEPSLLTHLSITPKELKKIWWYRDRMYETFEIAKAAGKTRQLSAPNPRLKFIQRRISKSLDQVYKPRAPVHGFVAERSVKTNANSHLKRRYLLNLDLKQFFPSITENRVRGLLTSLGMDRRVAEIIARICCREGHLPQGAPTSPVISNLLCFRLDKALMDFAKQTRCIYTRYADDITFSSHQPLTLLFDGAVPPAGRFPPELLTAQFRSIVEANGFEINADKLHHADRHSRRTVTGLKVNELLNVDCRYIRNIRAALYTIQKKGLPAAEDIFSTKYGGRSGLAAHLRGKLAWLRHIRGQTDPVFRSLARRYNSCFPGGGVSVVPTNQEVLERAVWILDNDKAISQGTAFFLKGVGLVTAAHCIEKASEVQVYHPSKTANKFIVRIDKVDAHRDLALLSHSIPATEFFELGPSKRPVVAGDPTTAIGFPSSGPGDTTANVRPGSVTTLVTHSGVKKVEVSQKLAQGMSGGPLLDRDGHVAGIIHKGGPKEGRDFAVSIAALNEWLGL